MLTTNDISVEIDFNTTGKNYVEENVVVNGEHCTLGSVSGSFGEDMVVTIGIDQDGYVIDACNVTVGDVYVEDPQMSDGHIVTIPAHYFSKYNETVSIGVTITGREIKVEAIAEEDSHFTLSVRQHK
ncbi:MAG: hypothetical protein MJ219_03780 [Mycoplasmoidaceae bacterium]|nr:hypothetical protein [Mycoplasmoidaceae bacterium]